MDICAFPMELQHHILRRMDMQHLLKTAATSKTMMETVRNCREKYWDVWVNKDRKATCTVHDRKMRHVDSLASLRLFFDGATIRYLTLRHPLTGVDIRSKTLSLNYNAKELLPILRRHKSAGSYTVNIQKFGPTLPPDGQLLEWLNENVVGLSAERLAAPLTEYIRLKVPTMRLGGRRAESGEIYAQLLIEEWLKGERQIERITMSCQPWYPECPAPLKPYRLYQPTNDPCLKGRLPRADGAILTVLLTRENIHLSR